MMWLYAVAWPPQGIDVKKRSIRPLINKAALNALDKATQAAVLEAGSEAEVRGWATAKAKNIESIDLLKKNGVNIVAPPAQLKTAMKKVGDTLLREWLEKAGPGGRAVVDAYKKM